MGIKQAVSEQISKGYVYDPEWYDSEDVKCEAPNVWKRIGEDKWVLMYDIYGLRPPNFGFRETSDFKNFTNLGRFNEGVMKATAHWLELKGHTPKSPSMIFDEVFSEQIIERGKIEDTEVLMDFFKRTKQPLLQDWLKQIVINVALKLPFAWGLKSVWAMVFKPKTRNWKKARLAIEDYIHEQEEAHRKALGLDAANTTKPSNDDAPRQQVEAAE